jgi:acetolactate synthase-1/2/3 large subunit
MNCNELATAQYYSLPIITVLFNNSVLGMVRQWQALIYDKRYSQTTLDRGPDFVKLAEAYGVTGRRVDSVAEFATELQKALARNHSTLIECPISMDETVRPMVGSGSNITDFMLL